MTCLPVQQVQPNAVAPSVCVLSISFKAPLLFSPLVLATLPALAVAPQPVQAKMTQVAAAVVAPVSPSPLSALEVEPVVGPGPALGDSQKNVWSYLEEIANTLSSNVQQLKTLIEQAKGGQAEATGVKGHGGRKEVKKTTTRTFVFFTS